MATKRATASTPPQNLRPQAELVLTLEERLERIERDLLESKLVGYCACNYARVICEEMGLRSKVKKIDEEFENLRNGDF